VVLDKADWIGANSNIVKDPKNVPQNGPIQLLQVGREGETREKDSEARGGNHVFGKTKISATQGPRKDEETLGTFNCPESKSINQTQIIRTPGRGKIMLEPGSRENEKQVFSRVPLKKG